GLLDRRRLRRPAGAERREPGPAVRGVRPDGAAAQAAGRGPRVRFLSRLLLTDCATTAERPAWPLDRLRDAIDHCIVLGEAVEVIRAGECAVVVCTGRP